MRKKNCKNISQKYVTNIINTYEEIYNFTLKTEKEIKFKVENKKKICFLILK